MSDNTLTDKSSIVKAIKEKTNGVTEQQINKVLDGLSDVIISAVENGVTQITPLSGILKLSIVRKDETKERTGTNPRTTEKIVIPAKPARMVAKVKVLGKLQTATNALPVKRR